MQIVIRLTFINPLLPIRTAINCYGTSVFWPAINGASFDNRAPWTKYAWVQERCDTVNRKKLTDKYSVGWCAERNQFELKYRFDNGKTAFVIDIERKISRLTEKYIADKAFELFEVAVMQCLRAKLEPDPIQDRPLTLDDFRRAWRKWGYDNHNEN